MLFYAPLWRRAVKSVQFKSALSELHQRLQRVLGGAYATYFTIYRPFVFFQRYTRQ